MHRTEKETIAVIGPSNAIVKNIARSSLANAELRTAITKGHLLAPKPAKHLKLKIPYQTFGICSEPPTYKRYMLPN